MPRKPASGTRSADRIYTMLRTAIVNGEYLDAKRLTEEVLAERFGVSRTPVRVALHRLASDGFVEMVPHSGAMVRHRSREEIAEIFEVRALLESRAAKLAALSRTPDDLKRLASICERMEALGSSSGKVESLSDLNQMFHIAILEISRNKTLLDTAARLIGIGLLVHSYKSFNPRERALSMDHHRELLRAISSRDGEWASSVMCAHILAARDTLTQDGARLGV